jgi:dipeptidyl aminopeptidase/acylaminoacyl peptidase
MADFDAEQLTKLGRVSEVVPSPDGSWAAVEVQRLDAQGTRYVSDLWSVSLERGARPPRQLTRGDCRDRSPRFRRDGSLGFLSNRNPRAGEPEPGDTERAQVWLLPSGGGPAHSRTSPWA